MKNKVKSEAGSRKTEVRNNLNKLQSSKIFVARHLSKVF